MPRQFFYMAFLAFLMNACHGSRPAAGDPCAEPVKTEAGLIRGLAESGTQTCAWHGVPYAAPPTGEQRFRAPGPVKPWAGVRDGKVWGHRCTQKNTLALRFFNSDPSGDLSEDCLYLNVWRPQKPGKYPVMVWIPGGGYGIGTGNTPSYWGDRLSETGQVVVVTINYRLGYFASLTLPKLRDEDPNHSAGSYGALDQVAALKWVNRNVENFGGDPGNVTVFGESAGGWSVCSLLASPLAKGLFHRAIMESGGCGQSATLEAGFEEGKVVAKSLGCGPDDLICLRQVPAEKIVEVAPTPTFTRFSFGPHQDGYFLSDQPLTLIRSGNSNRVPYIGGTNRDEMKANVTGKNKELRDLPPAQYQEKLAALLPIPRASAQELAKLYPLGDYDNKPINAYAQMVTDFAFACPTFEGLQASAQFMANTYQFRFDWDEMRGGQKNGAMHGMDVPFVFNSFDRRMFNMFYSKSLRQKAAPLARSLQSYWINFAKTGDPNGPGLPLWPKLDPGDPYLLVFDNVITAQPAGLSARCKFWKEHETHLSW